MRKYIYVILSAALLSTALSCQKDLNDNTDEIVPDQSVVGENSEVTICASIPQTRTSLNTGTYALTWAQGDQIAVFNAPTGTDEYSGNLKFVMSEIDEDGGRGTFVPAVGVEVPFEDGSNYDWFVCSPYRTTNGNVELATPKGESTDDGYFPIGNATQNKYDDATHISSNDIMVGKVTDTRTPNITLKHLAVLHKFTVVNNSDKPTVIKKLTLNGGDNKLFGTFWIDLTSDNPAIDVNKANGAFSERSLTVNNGEELPVGESADFYILTAPFTLDAGEIFKVTIETSTGSQVVEKTAVKDVNFLAGTYNTATLAYDYVPVYADHLYSDTFQDSSITLPTSGGAATSWDNMDSRWNSYMKDMSGLSVYDGIKSDITFEWSNTQLSAQVAASALIGMVDTHVWFKDSDGANLIVKGIKLHGKTNLTLSFLQTYKNSGLKLEYSVDDCKTWIEIGTATNPSSATCEERLFNFTVSEESQVINIRFTRTATAPRIDNVKLTWQNE